MTHQHSNDSNINLQNKYLIFDLRMSTGRRIPPTPNIKVRAWFTHSPQYCKAIWSMAVAQHQFYLDKRNSRVCLIRFILLIKLNKSIFIAKSIFTNQ
jgi:hypothetical protein